MLTKEQWFRRYEEELYIDFDNTSESDYKDFEEFKSAMWESYNDSQIDSKLH